MYQPLYTTTDIYLAAFLLDRGASYGGCTRVGPKTTEFRFVGSRDLHAWLRLYWSCQPTPVVPAQLFACHHRLKCLLIAQSR